MLTASDNGEERRKPLEFLSNIFKKKKDNESTEIDIDADASFEDVEIQPTEWHPSSNKDNVMVSPNSTTKDSLFTVPPTLASAAVAITISMASQTALMPLPTQSTTVPFCNGHPCSPSSMSSSIGSPIILHHTPIRSRDIGDDMEQIRLSRQDNPYLQRVAGSQSSLIDDEVMHMGIMEDDEDTAHLVSQTEISPESLSISEVHEHLIRSPPPTSVPKTLTGKTLFVFDQDLLSDNTVIPSSQPGVLLPVQNKSNDDMCVQQIRQIIEDQKNLTQHREVPIPVNIEPTRTQSFRRSSQRTRSDSGSPGNCGHHNPIMLAPVQPPRKKHSVPNEVFLNRPLLTSPRLTVDKEKHFRRSSSLRGSVCSVEHGGSPPILSLPIQSPHQPSGQLA